MITAARLRALVAAVAVMVAGLAADVANAETRFSGVMTYGDLAAAAKRGKVVITHSPGGSGAAAMALARAPGLVIDGYCASACAWAFVANPRACFTQSARFDFHQAQNPVTGVHMPGGTAHFLSTARPALRKRVAAVMVSPSLVTVSSAEMRAYYPDRACR